LQTLLDFRYKKIFRAKPGKHGQGAQKTGRDGEDVVIKVPCGTIVLAAQGEKILQDMVKNGHRFIVAKGGKGGKGNQHFATPTQRTPRFAEDGQPGEVREIMLQLKLIADVGLVGLPNAGKSTLLSQVSAARPKIADYPFTTLTPHLGIVKYKEHQSFVMADIPGLIEGAHVGRGLGLKFLRHIERTKVLAFLVDATSEDIKKDYHTLKNELHSYKTDLLDKPSVLVLTKSDLLINDFAAIKKMLKNLDVPIHFISAISGQGLEELIKMLWSLLNNSEKAK